VETQNITLSLPKKTLRKIKLLAVKRQSSVSKMLTEALEKIADEESGYEEARKRQMEWMEKGFDLGFRSSKLPGREELHERR